MHNDALTDILHAELLNVSECARGVIENRTRLTPDQKALRYAIKRLDAVFTKLGKSAVMRASLPEPAYEIVEEAPEPEEATLFVLPDAAPPVRTGRPVLDLR